MLGLYIPRILIYGMCVALAWEAPYKLPQVSPRGSQGWKPLFHNTASQTICGKDQLFVSKKYKNTTKTN